MISPDLREALDELRGHLRRVFGARLRSIVLYGAHAEGAVEAGPHTSPELTRVRAHTLVLVDRVTFDDLAACAVHAPAWGQRGLAVPLLLPADEFLRSLDAFPLEYGDILSRHVTLEGEPPFGGVQVKAEDVRRACEVRAKSHVIHLREGFLEAAGRPASVAALIAASAASLSSLLNTIERLHGRDGHTPDDLARDAEAVAGLPAAIVRRVLTLTGPDDLPPAEAMPLYSAYLAAAEQLAAFVDGWSGG